jgi:hypothetical protein
MIKKIIILLGIFVCFFLALYVFYYTPYDTVKRTLLKTDVDKKIIKEYLQQKTNLDIPKEYEIIEIIMKYGKDKIFIVRGVLRGNIEQFLFLLGNDYKKTSSDNSELFSLTNDLNQYTNIYKLTKQNDNLLMEVIVAQTNMSDEYVVYFRFADNHFPHYNIFTVR